ncbi:lipopolysaccharide transport periplasmic protein LptA [Motiliproteus sp.]|uniref:lipopolysaccharide transport periplasmic protein LptA n=1 Tax=Motiliproteus sp. TaxID=1898955 RepID=UPI003BABD62E
MKRTSRCPHLLNSIFLGALLLASSAAQALPEDKEQPINIAADSAELDDGKRTAIYTGAVKLVQGTLELEADKLTLYANDKGDINRIVATGKPAHFQQQHQAGAPLTHGYGLTIEFEVLKDLLTLTEQAKLVRASDTFTGQQIKVNTNNNVIRAFSDENKPSSRVEMVIQPRSGKKDNSKKDNAQ